MTSISCSFCSGSKLHNRMDGVRGEEGWMGRRGGWGGVDGEEGWMGGEVHGEEGWMGGGYVGRRGGWGEKNVSMSHPQHTRHLHLYSFGIACAAVFRTYGERSFIDCNRSEETSSPK